MPRKGENIYKRKDGRWEGRYIKKYDINNKAVYGYVYAHSYTEVKTKLNDAKSNGTEQSNNNIRHSKTLEYYSVKWLDESKSRFKQSTYVKYVNIIRNHLIPSIGRYMIATVSTDLAKKLVDEKITTGNIKTGKGLSTKSIKDIVSVLRMILLYAESKGEKVNCNVDMISVKTEITKNECLNKSEQMILTQYLINDIDYIKLGILICLYTGLRIGEICAIQFKDILMKEKILTVSKTMQRIQNFSDSDVKTDVIITTPKSQTSVREIPIPDFLIEILGQFHNTPNAYLLTGRSDKYMEPRTLYNKFKVCVKQCGIKEITFHQLRHRFATYCIEVGFEIKSLSEILGHSSVNITLNRYVHSSMELKRINMSKLQENMNYLPSNF